MSMAFLSPSPMELMVIAVLALIVLGPSRLPEVARSVGRGVRELRSSLQGVRDDDDEGGGSDRDDPDEPSDEPDGGGGGDASFEELDDGDPAPGERDGNDEPRRVGAGRPA